MATPLRYITDILDTFKGSEIAYLNTDIPLAHTRNGVIQTGVHLDKDFKFIEIEKSDGTFEPAIDADLSSSEIFLAGICSARSYFFQEHHNITQKAVNFKTINFQVSGLTERAKEMMRMVWWCDNQIESVLKKLRRHDLAGSTTQMEG